MFEDDTKILGNILPKFMEADNQPLQQDLDIIARLGHYSKLVQRLVNLPKWRKI